MDPHVTFAKWARSKGVRTYGISSHRFEGRGMGIIADKRLEPGSTILSVPTTAIRTVYTVSPHITDALRAVNPDVTVHCLLAVDLCFDSSTTRGAWRAVLPTMADFEASMPFLQGPDALLSDTSPPAEGLHLLANQRKKYDLDYATATTAFSSLIPNHNSTTSPSTPSGIAFQHAWLLVNTRTFFYVRPGTVAPERHDDCMALVPFGDYFNHAVKGCAVQFDAKGYRFLAERVYEAGEEVCISYGAHSDAFLRVEYGFVLDERGGEGP